MSGEYRLHGNLRRISEEKPSRGAWKEGGKNLRTLFFLRNRTKVSERLGEDQRQEERGRIEKKGKSLIEATSNRSASQLSKGVERVK